MDDRSGLSFDEKNEKKQTYEYKNWSTLSTDMQPDGENYFRLIETNRQIEMTPTDYNNTNWNKRRILDSIRAVEKIKAHKKSRIEFEKKNK